MKICGIVVEYNPLHNGHLYHLEQVKKESNCDLLIAVMSGNYVQRGEPSIINKEIRTKLALQAGVDIVVELPYLYAVSHADLFSLGAISILNHCGVNEVIFGSESNNSDYLEKIAILLDSPSFNEIMKMKLDEGYSYPESCSIALASITNEDMMILSNDLLGIQYVRYINKINNNISFKAIKRIHTNYNDKELSTDKIASATSIRQAIFKNINIDEKIPHYTKEAIYKTSIHSWNDYFPYLKYQITNQRHNLSNIHDMIEGLEYRLIEQIKKAKNFELFTSSLVSKRYTKGKIQRLLTHVLNNVTKEEVNKQSIWNGPKYVRILGFKKSISHHLKLLKKTSQIPIVTNINKHNHDLLNLDLRTNDIYHLVDEDSERKIPIIY